jgi:hypothetical protein
VRLFVERGFLIAAERIAVQPMGFSTGCSPPAYPDPQRTKLRLRGRFVGSEVAFACS